MEISFDIYGKCLCCIKFCKLRVFSDTIISVSGRNRLNIAVYWCSYLHGFFGLAINKHHSSTSLAIISVSMNRYMKVCAPVITFLNRHPHPLTLRGFFDNKPTSFKSLFRIKSYSVALCHFSCITNCISVVVLI